MSYIPSFCSNNVRADGPESVLPRSAVTGTVVENILCQLPVEVARNVLFTFLDLADIVQLDSAAFVHHYRESFKQMYEGQIVSNTAILEIDLPTAQWLMSRTVYVQHMRINQFLVSEWPAGLSSMMREAIEVVIEPKTDLDSSKIRAILNNCPQLTSLSLQRCTFDAGVIQAVALMCPLVQEVSLAHTNADSTFISPLLSPRILSLDLSHCPHVDDATVVAVTAECSNLLSLHLDYCRICTGASLEVIASNSPQIQKLSVEEWVNVPEPSMMALAAGCRELRNLYLGVNRTLTSASVRAIACCTKLVDVTLMECPYVSARAIVALVSRCPELRIVDIQADDSVVAALLQHCPHLTDVTFRNIMNQSMRNNGFSGRQLATFLRDCQQLRRLYICEYNALPPCDGIVSSVEQLSFTLSWHCTDGSLISIMQYVHNLRKLPLAFGSGEHLTDAVVLAAANHCPLLEQINCDCLYRLTDASIIALAQRCPLLRKVSLSGCTLLTDVAVIAIAQHCPQLTHLNLHNYRVHLPVIPTTSNVLVEIPANAEHQEYEDETVLPATMLSDASIAALAAHSHRLRELDVHGHALVSEAALTALKVALPRCRLSKRKP